MRGKFGAIFQELVEDVFFSGGDRFEEHLGTVGALSRVGSALTSSQYFRSRCLG